jgi:hypothetical protein
MSLQTLRRAFLTASIIIIMGGAARAQKAYFPIMQDRPMEYRLQTAFCGEVPEPPVMDGRLDDACWKDVEPLGDFQLTNGKFENSRQVAAPGRFARHQTRVKVVRAENTLYIAFECLEPEMDKIRAEAVYHDEERICFDDRIVVFIDPGHDHQNVLQFVVNARGATLERPIARPVPYAMSHILGPLEWNTEWFARVRKLEDRWTGEISIAMDRLLGHAIEPGETIGLNICRDRRPIWRFGPTFQKFNYPQECSAWAYVYNPRSGSMSVDNWYEPIMFGDLVFDAKGIEVTKLAFYQSTADYSGNGWQRPQLWGDNPLEVTLRNSGKQPRTVRMEVTSKEAGDKLMHTADVVLPAGAEQTARVDIPIRGHDDQQFTLTLRDPVSGRQLYRTSYSTRVPPLVEFDLTSVYAPAGKASGGKASHGILFTPVAVEGALQGLTLQMSLRRSGAAQSLASRKVAELNPSAGFAEAFPGFDVATLEPGSYQIHCELAASDGTIVDRYVQPFTKPGKPAGP